MRPLSLPALLHVGFVVPDFNVAAADYQRLWGLDTVDIVDSTFENALYRGTTITLTARYGFIRSGTSELELIQPLSSPSPYADFLETNGGEGMHHLAYIVDKIEPYLRQIEATTRQTPDTLLSAPLPGDGRFTYIQGAAHGTIIELIELSQQVRARMPRRS
jgi:catechol 2,3-dioxygenase-like lactoylglutathione lyase family enzyme